MEPSGMKTRVRAGWEWVHGVALFVLVFGVVDGAFAVAQPRLSLSVRIFVAAWFAAAVAAASVSFVRGPSLLSIGVLLGTIAVSSAPYAATGGADTGILLTMGFFGLATALDGVVLVVTRCGLGRALRQ